MQTIEEILKAAGDGPISRAAIRWQAQSDGESEEIERKKMRSMIAVMREAAKAGLDPDLRSVSGRVGGQAARLEHSPLGARFGMLGKAATYALSIAESNACMGKIVAAPTAGACGILPGVLLAAQECEGFSDDALIDALFTAAAIGRVIAIQATISGAEGGCQAECGSAAAMAAAALTELYGGAAEAAADAAGFTLMNTMGLVCDPVCGLVEIPCVYRNAGGAALALSSAQLALSGVRCPLPCDEIIHAMKDVGDAMPPSLRETGEGGCAACPGAKGGRTCAQ